MSATMLYASRGTLFLPLKALHRMDTNIHYFTKCIHHGMQNERSIQFISSYFSPFFLNLHSPFMIFLHIIIIILLLHNQQTELISIMVFFHQASGLPPS